MKNPKKTIIPTRQPSLQLKKTVSVIKCFICNHMFYSQITFDQHMKLHSSKLNKNIPEQIQRKTMESFRIKKNEVLIGTSKQIGNKRLLNQTASCMLGKKQEEIVEDEFMLQDKEQMKRMVNTLRQSTLLIKNIQQIIKQPQQQLAVQKISQQIQQPLISQQQYSQQQFITKLLQTNLIQPQSCLNSKQSSFTDNKNKDKDKNKEKYIDNKDRISIIKLILMTKYKNQYLQSCKSQLQYLQQMQQHLQSNINTDKINKSKQTIVQAVISYIKANLIKDQQKSSKNKQQYDECTYLTDIKSTKKQHNKPKQKQIVVQKIQNLAHGYCNLCYSQIGYGYDCYQQQIISKKQQENIVKYHIQCWQQKQAQYQLNIQPI